MTGTEPPRLYTVQQAIDYAEEQLINSTVFFGHGCLDAYDEAVYLVLFVLGLPPDELEPYLDHVLTQQQSETLLGFLEQRINQHLPIPYITQESWLMGRRFYVDERVLIPRSFIAELLGEGLSPWFENYDDVKYILDLCTGSACLAILAAEEFPQSQVDAVDISSDALDVAKININAYDFKDVITLYQSDVYNSLPEKQYDLIISNPPYVNSDTMAQLPSEYQHEPSLALAGGTDGMDIVKRIIQDAKRYLSPHGILVLEIGNEYEFFVQAFPELNPVWLSTSAGEQQVLLLRSNQL